MPIIAKLPGAAQRKIAPNDREAGGDRERDIVRLLERRDEREVQGRRREDRREIGEVRLRERAAPVVGVAAKDEIGMRPMPQRDGERVRHGPARGRLPPKWLAVGVGGELLQRLEEQTVERQLRDVAQRAGDGKEEEAGRVAAAYGAAVGERDGGGGLAASTRHCLRTAWFGPPPPTTSSQVMRALPRIATRRPPAARRHHRHTPKTPAQPLYPPPPYRHTSSLLAQAPPVALAANKLFLFRL